MPGRSRSTRARWKGRERRSDHAASPDVAHSISSGSGGRLNRLEDCWMACSISVRHDIANAAVLDEEDADDGGPAALAVDVMLATSWVQILAVGPVNR